MNNHFNKIIKLDSEDCDCLHKGQNIHKYNKFKKLFPAKNGLMYKLNNNYLNKIWLDYKND
jgi:hypothetical protein